MAEIIRLRVKRQDGPGAAPYWEEFDIQYRANLNVIAMLQDIQQNPVNAKGQKTTPVVWGCNCLEEICGECAMVINGTPRQACSALVDKLTKPITVEPLSKFTIIRDLYIDRTKLFDALKKVNAWIPIDGTYDLGQGPKQPPAKADWMYKLSQCMTCGCCAESCPNYNSKSDFIGPAAISQVRLFINHPTGQLHRDELVDKIMGNGGIADCGKSQNCVQVCPKEIPLTTSLADMNREALKRWFSRGLRF